MADKLAVVRSFQVTRDLTHTLHEVYTGFESEDFKEFPGGRALRPAFGSVVSRLRGQQGLLPPYVSLRNNYTSRAVGVAEDPAYLGVAHRPFVPSGAAVKNLTLPGGVTVERLRQRRTLLETFDTLRRDLDTRGELAGMDAFTSRALELVTSAQVRDAFDVSLEPEAVRSAYGLPNPAKPTLDPQMLLQARRLVEAGVPVVTLTFGGWDHHAATGEPSIFTALRDQLPAFDQGLAALVSDLHQRGLSEDVAVVVWGEFGRTPRISNRGGRDHWPSAGFVLFSGGGLRMGQVIGGTDKHAARPTTRPDRSPAGSGHALSRPRHRSGHDVAGPQGSTDCAAGRSRGDRGIGLSIRAIGITVIEALPRSIALPHCSSLVCCVPGSGERQDLQTRLQLFARRCRRG